jgi:hypothetical protein
LLGLDKCIHPSEAHCQFVGPDRLATGFTVLIQKENMSQALVTHAYNPSNPGGRDQEDHDSKSAQANSPQDPILKNPSQERAGRVAQGVGPEFKPQFHKKKKKKEEEKRNHEACMFNKAKNLSSNY